MSGSGAAEDRLNRLREAVCGLARDSATAGAFLYVVGLLIVAVHLARYGVISRNLLRVDYIMAGLMWLVLTGLACSLAVAAVVVIKRAWKRSKGAFAASLVLGPLVANSIFGRALGMVTGQDEIPFTVTVIAHIVLAGSGLSAMCGLVPIWGALVGKLTMKDSSDSLWDIGWNKAVLVFFAPFFFLSGVALYALVAYPMISPEYGGGQPLTVTFLMKKNQAGRVREIGLGPTSGSMVGPVKLLFETDESYVVLLPHSGGGKALYLRKDLVDAALYLRPAELWRLPSAGQQSATDQNDDERERSDRYRTAKPPLMVSPTRSAPTITASSAGSG